MADRTILLAQNKRHATRGLSVVNPQEFLAYQEDDDNLTYIVDMGAYLDGATIVLVTRTPTGVVISNASNTTTRLTQRLAGYGHVDFRVQTSAGDTEQFRVYIQPRAANPAFFLTAGSGGGITALDGDKGDVIVSSAGSTWTLDAAAVASLNVFTDTLKGITPASGGGTSNFLRADGTWATPPGGGGGGGGPVSDADYGDITVSGTGTVWTIDNNAVTLAKMADMATASVIYRKTAGTGDPEVQTLATLKTDLGLTGTNSGDQTITLTGNVTGSGTGSFATTIAAGAVGLSQMANMATSSLIYRKTAGSGAPEVNTLATLKTDLGLTGTNSGDQTITLTGDVTGSGTGSFVTAIGAGVIVDADVNASAAIAYSKLASMTGGSVLLGNASNVPTVTALTGDVTVSNAGVTAIGTGVIVDGDVNASAAIALSKLATQAGRTFAGNSTTSAAVPTAVTAATAAGMLGLSVSLESYHTSGGGANATWQAALDAACSALSGTGGEITAYRDIEYAFTGYPAVIPAGVLIRGRPNITRFKLPSTGGNLLRFQGSLGTSYTLNSNAAIASNTISLTTNTSLAVNDTLLITNDPVALSLGVYTQIVEVESITGTGPYTVTIRGRLKFAVNTTDTYTINRIVSHNGGGACGIIFDGSICLDTTTRVARGIYAIYTRGLYIDDIGGQDVSGENPQLAVAPYTYASVLDCYYCYDMRGLKTLWATRSGSFVVCDIQFTGCNGHFGDITSRDASGFGPGWYNCFDVHVDSITSQFAQYRAGKLQCTLDFTVNSVFSDQPGYTGFGFTEGSKGLIQSATYNASRNVAPTQFSFWCNDTGVEVSVGQLRFMGATNTSGDIHTGTADKVWIGDVVTDNFTPTYAGTAGSAASGTGRDILRLNGVLIHPWALGTQTAPSIFAKGDPDSGVYWPGADQVALTAGGAVRAVVGTTSSYFGTSSANAAYSDSSFGAGVRSTASVEVLIDGDNNETTRYFGVRNNSLTAGSGGTLLYQLNESGQALLSDGTVSLPSSSFISDPDTGMYRVGANTVALAGGGVKGIEVNGSGNVGIPTADANVLFSVNATAKHPAIFRMDNSYYVYFGGNAATNGSVGFSLYAKDSGGTDYYSFVLAQAGTMDFQGPFSGNVRFGHSSSASGGSFTERMRIDGNGNVVINTAALATTATNGFLYVPTCAGTPTGTPTTYTGRAPIVVDTTNNKLYFYSGGAWRDAGP